jgi:exopolysaccharide biosynthesis polyprenyl glycosylphosphotransferase
MLRRNRQIKMQIQRVLDAGLFGCSLGIAWILRANHEIWRLFHLKAVKPSDDYIWLYLVVIFFGPLLLAAQGFYDRPLIARRRAIFWPLFKGCLVATVALVVVLFFMQVELARTVALLFGAISFTLIMVKEELLRAGLRSKFARSQLERKFVLIGTPEETALMRRELKESVEGVVVLGELDLNTRPVEALTELLHEHSVNGVILNARHNYFEKVESAIQTCELEGVEVWLVADFFKTQISHTSFDDFHGRPVLVFRTTPEASWQSVSKQALDFVVAFLAVGVLSPFLFLPIALLIKLSSPGPILFRQKRSGLNGQPFTIFKFRTMTTDAEQRKHELAAMNEMSGPVFKIKNDPRVTRIGKILRKFSLDEFPQLFNVLRGEMSLVGPRPLPVDEVKRFDDLAHRRRLSVKPGLTCLWQVSGRNDVSDFKDWVRLDLEYIDNWSLWLDLKIIWRTIPIVLIGTGAR